MFVRLPLVVEDKAGEIIRLFLYSILSLISCLTFFTAPYLHNFCQKLLVVNGSHNNFA